MSGAILLLPLYAFMTCTGQVYIQILRFNTANKHSKGNDACRVAVPDMRTATPHGELWSQFSVFRPNFVTHNTTNNQALRCTMTNCSDTQWLYKTLCCATTPNTPCILASKILQSALPEFEFCVFLPPRSFHYCNPFFLQKT